MSRLHYFLTQSIDWSLHKKWSFPSKISSVNVTKPAVDMISWQEKSDESILFFLVFFLEKTSFYLLVFCSLHRDST